MKSTSSEEIEAEIYFEKDIYIIDEDILFRGDRSKGPIKEYSWDFGDGNTSNEMNPVHTYTVSGWYTIMLEVHGSDDERSNTSNSIGIQMRDTQLSEQRAGTQNWYPPRSIPLQTLHAIFPNIKNPSSSVHIEVNNIQGRGSIIIDMNWQDSGGIRYHDILYERAIESWTGENIEVDFPIEPDVFNACSTAVWGYLRIEYVLELGRDSGASIQSEVVFPVDIEQ